MGVLLSKQNDQYADWNNEFAQAEAVNRRYNQGQELRGTTPEELSSQNITNRKLTEKTVINAFTREEDVQIKVTSPRICFVSVKFTLKVPSVNVSLNIWGKEKFDSEGRLTAIEAPLGKINYMPSTENPQIEFQLDLNYMIENRDKLGDDSWTFIIEVFEPTVTTIYCFRLVGGKTLTLKLEKKAAVIHGVYNVLTNVYGLKGSSVVKGEEGELCLICFTNFIDVIIRPCMHMCMCHDCAKELSLNTKKCPMCRDTFVGFTKLELKKEQ